MAMIRKRGIGVNNRIEDLDFSGGGGFSFDDGIFLDSIIYKYNIKSVLEYGCGVSTRLLLMLGVELLSLESRLEYANVAGASIITYKYPDFPIINRFFDLAFIDGPGAYEFECKNKIPERKFSAIHAAGHSSMIFLHDGGLGQIDPLTDRGFKPITLGDLGVGGRNIIFIK